MISPQPDTGSIVKFKPYGYPDEKLRAAIITSVHVEEDVVDICVFRSTGIEFLSRVNKGDREGQWSWPVIEGEE